MKKRLLIFGFVLCSVFILLGQEPIFRAKVNLDSVLLGNHLEVSFIVENVANARVEAPSFEGFSIVGGPNYASSMSMINGDVTQSVIHTYWLEPKDVGQYYIGSAQVNAGDTVLETSPIEINVYHNPDGVVQKPQKDRAGESFFQWSDPTPLPKKKPKKRGRFIGCNYQ